MLRTTANNSDRQQLHNFAIVVLPLKSTQDRMKSKDLIIECNLELI
jgi:hypothetical protein